MRNRRRTVSAGVAALLALTLAVLAGCHRSAITGEEKATLGLTSASFPAGEIPKKFTCNNADISPELAWAAPPAKTQSFALIVIDEDAPLGSFVHWVLYNLPADRRELPEGLAKENELADGTRQGVNDFDKLGYGGPCPPGQAAHRYVFTLYAVDTKLNLPVGATQTQVEKALKGHILAHGELTGRYQP